MPFKIRFTEKGGEKKKESLAPFLFFFLFALDIGSYSIKGMKFPPSLRRTKTTDVQPIPYRS